MDQKHPRQSAHGEVLIKEELTGPRNSSALNCVHVRGKTPPNLCLHFSLFQVDADEAAKLFEVTIERRRRIRMDVYDKTQFAVTNCQFRVIRAVDLLTERT